MRNIKAYIPKGVLEKIKTDDEEEIIYATKKKYLEQINALRGGKALLLYLGKKCEVKGKTEIDELCKKLDLSEVWYYLTYIHAANTGTYVYAFDKKFSFDPDDSNLFNKLGQPVWEKIEYKPRLWVAHKEDQNNQHIYLSFVLIGKSKTYFDMVSQSFIEYTTTGLVNCRIHSDDSLIEITPKDTDKGAVRDVLDYIKVNFNIGTAKPIEITDEDIRVFDKKAEETTYEKREGEEANITVTRAYKGKDTRKDSIRKDIEDREFSKEHGLISIDEKIKTIVGLTRGERGKIQIKSYLKPNERIKTFHLIKDMLGW